MKEAGPERAAGRLERMSSWPAGIVGFLALCYLAGGLERRGLLPAGRSLRVLLAAVACGGFVVLSSELAGAVGAFRPPVLVGCWVALSVVAAAAGFQLRKGAPAPAEAPEAEKGDPFARLLRGTSFALWLLLLPVALLVPQTNHDVQTYHLPRVLSWLQQGSLAPYATNDYRALDFAPFASMAVGHLLALGGGDALAGCLQWAALGGGLVAAGLLARFLSGTPPAGTGAGRAAAAAQLFAATIPLAVLQATTAQNDLTAAFWLVTSVSLGVAALEERAFPLLVAGAATAFALAVLTKETTAFFGVPFAAALGVLEARRDGPARAFRRWAVPLLLAFAVLHTGHHLRRWAAFGTPLGSPLARQTLLSSDRGPSAVASSAIRNLALYSGTGSPALTGALNALLLRVHALTGRDPNDPATTYAGARFAPETRVHFDDSRANLPSSLAVVLLSALLLLRDPGPGRVRAALWILLVAAGGLLFCALVRWQLFNVRFHLAGFVLAAPAVGAVLARRLGRVALSAVAALLVGTAGLAVAANRTGPFGPTTSLLGRGGPERMFAVYPGLFASYRNATDAIRLSGCRDVGFALMFLEPEFPLWRLLDAPFGPVRLRYVGPDAIVPPAAGMPEPCVVLVSEAAMPDATLEPLPEPDRLLLPDRSRFGNLRLLLAPSSSGLSFLARRDSRGGLVTLKPGDSVEVGPAGAELSFWSFRPGAFAVELSLEGAGPGRSLVVRDGWGAVLTLTTGAEPALFRAAAPGGVHVLRAVPGAPGPGTKLRVGRIVHEPSGEGWSALRVSGSIRRPDEEGRVVVGPFPTRLELLSRRGGVLRLTGSFEPAGPPEGAPSLVVEGPGGTRTLGAGGRVDLAFRTGAEVVGLVLRSTGAPVVLRDLRVSVEDASAPHSGAAGRLEPGGAGRPGPG